jgi:thiamine pyrophosphokinase
LNENLHTYYVAVKLCDTIILQINYSPDLYFMIINYFMKCVIIANGDLEYTSEITKTIKNAQLIISADGGARHLRALNILPHVIIGDFDSIHKKDYTFFQKKQVKIINFPLKKDYTDTQLCVSYALEHEASDITLFGVTGSRVDHTIANIFLLKRVAELNIPARIINRHNEIYIVTNHLELKGHPKELLSIIPVTPDVTGVTLTGLEYPLHNAHMKMGESLGISNVFNEAIASISIASGMVIVTKSKD